MYGFITCGKKRGLLWYFHECFAIINIRIVLSGIGRKFSYTFELLKGAVHHERNHQSHAGAEELSEAAKRKDGRVFWVE